jgi:hypothetical protein
LKASHGPAKVSSGTPSIGGRRRYVVRLGIWDTVNSPGSGLSYTHKRRRSKLALAVKIGVLIAVGVAGYATFHMWHM